MTEIAAATLRWQRWLVLAALVGTAWLVWPAGEDNFSLPKATFLVLVALAIAWAGVIRWCWSRRLVAPRSPVLVAVAVFGLGMVVATFTSTTPIQSVVGQYKQFGGLSTYLACIVVFLAAMRAFEPEHVILVLRAFVVAMLGVAGYGLLQVVGADPADWSDTSQIVATMGNSNFAAGWLAIALAPCAVLTFRRREPAPWRVAATVGLVAGLVVLLATDSFQGPIAGGVSLLVAAATVVEVRRPLEHLWTRRNVLLAGGVVVVVGALALVVGWSFLRESMDQGLYDRRAFWSAAWDVFGDEPLTGTGPDTFHNQFLPRRPVGHVGNNAGAAHDVPLDMLANGGLVVALPYLAILGLTGVAFVRLWRRTEGDARLIIGGLAGAWAGYVVQSLVSIDRPGLVTTHWVLAGIAAGLASSENWVLSLPGADRRRPQGAAWLVPAGVVTVAAVAALFPLTRPVRAEMLVARADEELARRELEPAIEHVERGMDLAPWEASYTYVATRIYAAAGRRDEAIAAAEEGARLEPGDGTYAVFAAQALTALGAEDRATQWWEEAIRRDPWGSTTVYEATLAAGRRKDLDTIEALLQRYTRISKSGRPIALEAEALQLAGENDRARELWLQVLEADPDNEKAKESLEQLGR